MEKFTLTTEQQQELERQYAILTAGVEHHEPKEGLRAKLTKSLATSTPLRVKLGVDPTAPDIHLGHTVPLQLLRKFQDCGHTAILLIGDYTARIGDPSGRNKTRPTLDESEIDANAETYLTQANKVLSQENLEVRRNGEWLGKLGFVDMARLCGKVTVAQIMQREDFHNRFHQNLPISMHELLYPIMQGYDSVALNADIELGGTDQLFNCLMGRELQKVYEQAQQTVMTMPLLEGTDGEKKMSKSLSNYIGVTDEPNDMYGKVMSIPDELMNKYFTLLTSVDTSTLPTHPMDAKKQLAHILVTRFHDESAATAAAEDFTTRFSKRDVPEDLPEHTVQFPIGAAKLLVELNFAESNSAARRLIQQGAVKQDGEKITDPQAELSTSDAFVLQAGKRRMARVVPA